VADAAALYVRLVGARLRSQLQYRASLALESGGQFLVGFLDFAAIVVLFHNVPALGEWSVAQVALLFGLSGLAFSLTDALTGNLDRLPQLIRDGNFDLVLVRPRGTLFQVATSDFQLRRLARALMALGVLVYALTANNIAWTVPRVLVLLVAVPAGIVVFTGVWVTVICIVFWVIEGTETASTFTYGGQYLAQYPINIFDDWLRRFLAYVVPTAFVVYFPALYVLDKPDPLGLPHFLQFLSPLAAVAAALVASVAWRTAVRHYQSAGG
jgi:ABC-2 type transport system permease protein